MKRLGTREMLLRLVGWICLAVAFIVVQQARARDVGQFTQAPQHVRDWFKGLKIPMRNVPCCNEADGHRTNYEVKGGTYWVPIGGSWYAIPPNAVIRDSGNPTGEAIVFYFLMLDYDNGGQRPVILCFVPNDIS
jgi:hypothetical protein